MAHLSDLQHLIELLNIFECSFRTAQADVDLNAAQERPYSSQKQVDAFWEAAEGSMTLWKHVKVGDADSLESMLKLEIEFGRWVSCLSEGDLARVNGAVEVFAAQLESGDTVDDVSDDVIGAIGEERVKEGVVFVEWFEEHVSGFRLESGHFVLGKGLGRKCVYHAGKSGSRGLCEMVWEKVGRRWEWMSSHPDGFVVAGRELVALGRDRVGRVLMQYGGYGDKAVAMKLALYGGAEMEGEVRDVIGIEPYGGGGMFDEALEVRFVDDGGDVYCVADARGGRIVTGGGDMTVKVWDMYSGKCLMTLEGHTNEVNAVVMVGGRVISGSIDGTLRVWDPESGESKQVVEHYSDVRGLCVVDESSIVSCGERGAVFVWKIGEDGQLKKEKELKGRTVNCMIALGGGRLASGGEDEVILVHDVVSGDVIGKLEGHTDEVNDLAVLADGRLVSASDDKTLRVWSSTYTAEAEMVLEGHESGVNAVTAFENGMIVSADQAGWLRLWSVEESRWKALGEIKASTLGIYGLQALDGSRFVSVGDDGHVALWDVSRFDGENEQIGHESYVTCGAVLSDGRIVSGGYGGEIVMWKKPEKGKEGLQKQVIEGPDGIVRDLVETSIGFAWRSENCFYGGTTVLWDQNLCEVTADSGLKPAGQPINLGVEISNLCTIEEGAILVGIGTNGDMLYALDVVTRKMLTTMELDQVPRCLHPLDSERVGVGGPDGQVLVINARSGLIEKEVVIGSCGVRSLVSFGNDKLFVTTDREVWLWEPLSGFPPEQVIGSVKMAFVALDSERVVLNNAANELVVWNWKMQEREVEFGGLNALDVLDVAWDATRRLAVCFMQMERCWYAYEL